MEKMNVQVLLAAPSPWIGSTASPPQYMASGTHAVSSSSIVVMCRSNAARVAMRDVQRV